MFFRRTIKGLRQAESEPKMGTAIPTVQRVVGAWACQGRVAEGTVNQII